MLKELNKFLTFYEDRLIREKISLNFKFGFKSWSKNKFG